MEKLSVKLSTKILLTLASLILIYGLMRQFNSPVSQITSVKTQRSETIAPAQNSPKTKFETTTNLPVKQYDCVSEGLPTSLDNEAFESWVKGRKHTHEWHWDNYHAENAQGEKIIFHVVKEQDQNGNEILLLKTFKDEEEGPVLSSEKRFYQREKLNSALDKILAKSSIEIRQTIDSFQFPDGSEFKRTIENGEIQELRIVSEKGILDCQKSQGITSCHCK